MANVFGNKLKVSIFGESHGNGIGVVIDGLPSGQNLDMAAIQAEMQRRAPGKNALATPRKEADKVEILSGVFNGATTGAPLCGVIYNTNTRSGDYTPDLPRPGHADFTANAKFGGFQDYRGGGHFSGRITAPLTFAGAVAKQVLAGGGVIIGSHIKNIAGICDDSFGTQITEKQLLKLCGEEFPLLRPEKAEEMTEAILTARQGGDSVGGIIECAAVGLPAGIGSPFFESMESRISAMMFSIPAVKGIEFGLGFGFADIKGSVANDAFAKDENGKIITLTNNNGGINGGITNGMPLVFSVCVKPTPSIAKPQTTVNMKTGESETLCIHGRHDPCIVIRALPVVEAGLAICLLDSLL